jgi:hypothetical protein
MPGTVERDIDDRFIGADWVLEFEIPDITPGITLTECTWRLKDKKGKADADALITKTVTTAVGPSGTITQVGQTAIVILVVPDTENKTIGLKHDKEYYHRMPCIGSDGSNLIDEIAVHGTFIPR